MKNLNGLFITFEGPEASGKSSQIILLKKYLKKNKIPFLVTREPGGTVIAEKLRKIILNKKNKISDLEEILLLMAARLNHINSVIKPALNKGKIVISDRFADSTFVYQGYVSGFGIKKAKFNWIAFLDSDDYWTKEKLSTVSNVIRKTKYGW